MQKHVNLVDLVKSFPTNIFLQNLASIQKRTSPIKFAHLAEKSEKGSIPNLSTKVGELEMLSDAINDRKACKPGREPTLLVKEAENTYANLEAVLLNARRQNDIGPGLKIREKGNK